MSERARFLLVFVMVLAVMAVVVTGVRGHESSTVFHESFDGSPSAPLAMDMEGWDLQYHSRHQDDWETPLPVDGHHGPNCEAPMATHTVDTWPGSIYQCADHMMTAVDGDNGYALLYMTPDHMVDWSDGEAVIRFDVSTFNSSPTRDWFDVWITPWDDNMARPFDNFDVDLAGVPEQGLQFELNPQDETLCIKEFVNHDDVESGECKWWSDFPDEVQAKSDEQRAQDRETFEIRISQSQVTVGMPEYDHWWDTYNHDGFPYMQGVVQFGHHSYTPTKDGGQPNTWHWDEIHIEPAVPFTMVGADDFVVRDETETVTFDAPAPADAYLRFAAIGTVEVSLDGGPWEPAQKQAQNPSSEAPEHADNYWHPVPEGTQSARFRFSPDSYQSTYFAGGFGIWSRSASIATATPTSTSTALPTSTPTATPEATSTPTTTPTATPTTAPTSTPTPEPPTATPTPVCHNAIFVGDELTKGGQIDCP